MGLTQAEPHQRLYLNRPGADDPRMPGRIKSLIDTLMERRAGKNDALRHFVRSHLILKGINPDRFDETSPDDPEVISRLEVMLEEYK